MVLYVGTNGCVIKKNTNDSLFAEYSFKKQVSTKIHMHDIDVIVIGSLWELGFSQYIDESVQIFALDCGLGEKLTGLRFCE